MYVLENYLSKLNSVEKYKTVRKSIIYLMFENATTFIFVY